MPPIPVVIGSGRGAAIACQIAGNTCLLGNFSHLTGDIHVQKVRIDTRRGRIPRYMEIDETVIIKIFEENSPRKSGRREFLISEKRELTRIGELVDQNFIRPSAVAAPRITIAVRVIQVAIVVDVTHRSAHGRL